MYRLLRAVLIPLAVVVAFAACSDEGPTVSERDAAAGLQTDALSYRLQRGSAGWEASIGYEIVNRVGQSLHIANCRGAYAVGLELLVADGRWEQVWGSNVPLCLSDDIVLRPGGVLVQTLPFFAAYDRERAGPAFDRTVPHRATYRLVVSPMLVATDMDRSRWTAAPAAQLRSNAFTLTFP